MASVGDWARVIGTTIVQHLREEELAVFRKFKVFAMLEQSGNVLMNQSGRGFDWNVRYRNAPVSGSTGDTPRTFARQNLWKRAELPYRGFTTQDSIFRRNRRLVVFDMDSTLIDAAVIDELAKAAGVGEQVSAITERAMRGELDFKASFRERVSLLKGLPESTLEQIAATLRLTEGAETLISQLRRLGYKTAILSGGFTYFAERLQKKLDIDYVYANTLVVRDGLVTGEVQEPIVDGQRKADLLRELAQREGISLEQTIAVGDGANDLPMLSIAGLGVAFRAKPLVKQSAKQAISNLGLDGILYLLGFRDRDGV